eukprot:SM000098S25109  [mRNA]  locus=s98:245941:246735:- [translate_table: standard]
MHMALRRCARRACRQLGYRDGVDAGKAATAQEGFDGGFHHGARAGRALGQARGAARACMLLPAASELSTRLRPVLADLAALDSQLQATTSDVAATIFASASASSHEQAPANTVEPGMDHVEGQHNPADSAALDTVSAEEAAARFSVDVRNRLGDVSLSEGRALTATAAGNSTDGSSDSADVSSQWTSLVALQQRAWAVLAKVSISPSSPI